MATSGSSNFTTTRNEIIRQSALFIRAISAGATMGPTMLGDFAHGLNAMVKHWESKGIRIWTVTEGTLFPQPSQIRYGVGGSATDHLTETYHDTTISAAEASGQTVLSVTSTADMAALDNIGIVTDDGTIHWTTIASKTATTVTINAALDDSAAEGNKVFTYTSKIVQPLKIVDARRYLIDDDTDTPITLIDRLDYQRLPVKTGAGSINQVFYDRQLGTGYIHLYQVPAATEELLKFTWHRPIQDFDASSDNPDLPQEWIGCIEYNLAVWMAPQFNVPDNLYTKLEKMALVMLDDLLGFDREGGSIFVQPE